MFNILILTDMDPDQYPDDTKHFLYADPADRGSKHPSDSKTDILSVKRNRKRVYYVMNGLRYNQI